MLGLKLCVPKQELGNEERKGKRRKGGKNLEAASGRSFTVPPGFLLIAD